MIINYIKIALRHLLKYKQSNLLNIAGLAVGLACCILCYLHIQFELGFDKFNSNYNQVYRLVAGNPNESEFWVKVAAPMPPAFKNQIPEINDYARLTPASYNPKVLVEYETNSFLEPYFMMADPSLFKLFSLPAIHGDPVKALGDLNSVVITESISKKLFGNENAIGKIIRLKEKDNFDFQVGAVVADVPAQSHFKFDYLISFENLGRVLGDIFPTSWGTYNFYAYVLLNDRATQAVAEQKIQAAKLTLPDSREVTFESIFLQPLKDIHFQYSRGNQFPSYDKTYIYVFLTIALSLLAIACINYLNLSIALSIKRIKEIGVRKSVGASRAQLIFQFINEGVITAFLALGLGLIFLETAIPLINSMFNSGIHTNYTDLQFLVFIFSGAIIVGLLSGSYLAFYVNRYKTSSILKGSVQGESKGISLQRGLVFLQFSISIILIACSFIINNQMRFLQNKNLGFDQAQVLAVPLSSTTPKLKVEELKNQLRQISTVADATASNFAPGRADWNQTVWWEGQSEPVSMFIMTTDKDFFNTMGVELNEGDMAKLESTKETQYLLNESAAELIGWDMIVGKLFSPFGENRKLPIAGVAKNFNFMSLHHEIAPLVIVVSEEFTLNQVLVKLSGTNLRQSVESVEQVYKNVLGDIPFEYSFMDDRVNQLYESETRVSRIVSSLTFVAVFFALFGVYGLISFSIENKTKEIAIRKVLGVASKDLLLLFSKSYYKLMVIAFIVSIPIVWKLMTDWLSNFSYKVEVNPIWFALAFIGVMIAITVIGLIKYFSLQKINPAQALKNE